jgi:hypothetical protein
MGRALMGGRRLVEVRSLWRLDWIAAILVRLWSFGGS